MGRSIQPSEIARYTSALKGVFEGASKHDAHRDSRPIMDRMARDPAFLTAILEKHLRSRGALNRTHYPVVTLDIEQNAHYHLVANCWIPLPNGDTDMSTKAIHHHGDMLLTTATAFGPGYEHWTFTNPEVRDPGRSLYSMGLIERAQHGLHQLAFVDAGPAHVPFYPASLTITYALWSNVYPVTWKDRLKRVGLIQRNKDLVRRLVVRAGLARKLDVAVVNYFDFYPSPAGFVGIEEREEFPRGPNSDYLRSLFYVLQGTGNEGLASAVRERVQAGGEVDDEQLVNSLVRDLETGAPIEPRLSEGHYSQPDINFTAGDVEQALAASGSAHAAA